MGLFGQAVTPEAGTSCGLGGYWAIGSVCALLLPRFEIWHLDKPRAQPLPCSLPLTLCLSRFVLIPSRINTHHLSPIIPLCSSQILANDPQLSACTSSPRFPVLIFLQHHPIHTPTALVSRVRPSVCASNVFLRCAAIAPACDLDPIHPAPPVLYHENQNQHHQPANLATSTSPVSKR